MSQTRRRHDTNIILKYKRIIENGSLQIGLYAPPGPWKVGRTIKRLLQDPWTWSMACAWRSADPEEPSKWLNVVIWNMIVQAPATMDVVYLAFVYGLLGVRQVQKSIPNGWTKGPPKDWTEGT